MWRFGFPNPVNYNDNELFCGGYAGKSMFSPPPFRVYVCLQLIDLECDNGVDGVGDMFCRMQCSGNKTLAIAAFAVMHTICERRDHMKLAANMRVASFHGFIRPDR